MSEPTCRLCGSLVLHWDASKSRTSETVAEARNRRLLEAGERLAEEMKRITQHPVRVPVGGRPDYGIEPWPPCQDIALGALADYQEAAK